jgi:hypothetical protein
MRSLRNLSFALFLILLLSLAGRAQTNSASVTMRGRVSQTVLITVAPDAQVFDDQLPISYRNLDAHTIQVSIATSVNSIRRISIPVQIRSNVGYTLSASTTSSGAALLRGLYITGVRATGKFVTIDAVEAINVVAPFDALSVAGHQQNVNQGALSFPSPATLLTGPRISTAGSFNSPHNAVEVMMLAEVEPPADSATRRVELIISASPDSALSAALSQP